ncbi:hypothetical protein JOB18_005544 [Solea senegalensis]|uniref:Secreted protein n=1 Tax=Solea senegalensis TaxID=28829 RepID=A0AAV6RWS3_SOLSE|nr:hypothetical protein JOB18_005544 [Solea senegalensis]
MWSLQVFRLAWGGDGERHLRRFQDGVCWGEGGKYSQLHNHLLLLLLLLLLSAQRSTNNHHIKSTAAAFASRKNANVTCTPAGMKGKNVCNHLTPTHPCVNHRLSKGKIVGQRAHDAGRPRLKPSCRDGSGQKGWDLDLRFLLYRTHPVLVHSQSLPLCLTKPKPLTSARSPNESKPSYDSGLMTVVWTRNVTFPRLHRLQGDKATQTQRAQEPAVVTVYTV